VNKSSGGRIAIVVPVGPIHERVKRCLRSCRDLDDDNYVTLLVTDRAATGDIYGARNIVTNSPVMTGPAVKRDAAIAAYPEADFYAFLDDDAYVDKKWLARLRALIAENEGVSAFGGPGLMPDDQTISEQLSAAVMESVLGSGGIRYRFVKMRARFCEDFPAYNLAISAECLRRIGGWGSSLYGGEDSLVCAKIIQSGGSILYDPSLYVRHYRRSIVPNHTWQVFNIGRSRACFIREGDPYSRRAIYFMPLLLSLATFVVAAACVYYAPLRGPGLVLFVLTWLSIAAFGHKGPIDFRVRLLLPLGIFLQQASYAYGFVLGLVTGRRNLVAGASPVVARQGGVDR